MIEKVNPSHPDKVADRIAGAIVDLAYTMASDPKSCRKSEKRTPLRGQRYFQRDAADYGTENAFRDRPQALRGISI